MVRFNLWVYSSGLARQWIRDLIKDGYSVSICKSNIVGYDLKVVK
jgi:hypothetical protein